MVIPVVLIHSQACNCEFSKPPFCRKGPQLRVSWFIARPEYLSKKSYQVTEQVLFMNACLPTLPQHPVDREHADGTGNPGLENHRTCLLCWFLFDSVAGFLPVAKND